MADASSPAPADREATTQIADCHNDLLVDLAYHRGVPDRFRVNWLGHLRQGGVAVQVCPVSVELDQLPETALRRSLEQILACHQIAAANPEDVQLVSACDDLDEAVTRGRIGMILAMEGVEPLGYSPELIEIFWLLGVRMVAITWNRQNPFAAGAAESATSGLTALGGKLLDLMLARGIVLDLAHSSQRTFFDVLERAAGCPTLVSHAGCRALLDTPRNLSDEQMRALAEVDGLLGVMAIPLGVDTTNPTIDRVVDHIDHAVGVMGVNRVALGGDFMTQLVDSGVEPPFPAGAFLPSGMSMGTPITGLAGPQDYPALIQALTRRGYSRDDVSAIAGGNLIRFLQAALPATTVPAGLTPSGADAA